MSHKTIPTSSDAKTPRTVHDSVQVGTATLTAGRPFRVTGSREKFVFLRWVVTDNGNWIEAVDNARRNRAFTVDRVSKVLPMPKEDRP